MFPSLDQAIGQFEGFGTPGTIATRQNNPGNLVYGPFAQSMGASGAGTNNIAIFPNSQTGLSAMDSLIQQFAGSGYNIQQLINTWAPGNAPGNSPQSTQNYTNYVAQQTGATPTTPVAALQQGNQILANAGAMLGGLTGSVIGGGTNPALVAQGSVQGGNAGSNLQTAISGWSFSRITSIAVGLIAIAGSIYLFKSDTINTAVSRGAEIFAA